MSEKILKIEERTFQGEEKWDTMEGYVIKTDKQDILIGICNRQSCCENWGYFSTNDDIKEFVGADLLDIKLTDTSLNTKIIEEKFEYGFDDGGIQFVDLNTSKGTLQFVVYNAHNGYYGHSIEIKSKQLNYKQCL